MLGQKKSFSLWVGFAALIIFSLAALKCAPDYNNPLDPDNPNKLLPPDAPSSLAAVAVTETTVTLSWHQAFGGEATLSVEKIVGGRFQEIAVLSLADTSFRDTGLISKTSYTYRVRLGNKAGASYSPEFSVKTLNFAPSFTFTRPAVQNDASLLIEWNDRDPDDDAGIQFFYDLTRTFKGTKIQTPTEISEDDPNQYLWNYDGSLGGGKSCNIYAHVSDSDTDFYVYAPGSFLLPVKPVYISFIEPADGETVGVASITLNGTVNATHGVDILRINKDNVPIVNANLWSKTVTLTPGQNLFQILVIDDSSFVFTDTLTVYYDSGAADLSPPALTVTQPAAGDTVSSPQVQLSGTAYDVSGVLSILVNGNPVQVTNPWSYSLPLTVEGANPITVSVKDNSPAQNEAVETLTVYYNPVVVDQTPPTLIITNPSDNDTLIGASVVVDGVAQDNGGVFSVKVGSNPEDLLPDSRGVWSTTVSLDSGRNTIVVIATDNAGNIRAESVAVWQNPGLQDKEPPEISITSPGNYVEFSNLSGIEILGTAYDNAGVDSVEVNGVGALLGNGAWRATVDFPMSDSGAYTFMAVATDIHGLRDTETVLLVYNPSAQDQIPPVITLLSPANGITVSTTPVPVWVRVKDDQSGVDSVTLNGKPATEVGADTFQAAVDLVKGPNDIVIRSVDKKGNAVSPMYRIILDDKAPKITLKSHTDGQQVPAMSVTVQVTVRDSISGIFSVAINDSAATLAGPDIYERSLTLAPSGTTAIVVTASDNSSFKNTAADTFHLTYNPLAQDQTAPVLSFISPASGTLVNSTPQMVTVRATDDVAVVSVTIGGHAASLVTSSADQYQASVALIVGQNFIPVVAQDAVPNRRTDTLLVTYNPPLAAVTLSAGSPVTASSIPLTWTQSTAPDFASYRLYYSASPGVGPVPANIARVDTNINAAGYTVMGLSEQKTYYFRLFVYDSFGDTAGSNEVNATTAALPDQSSPTASIYAPTNSFTTASSAITVEVTASDNVGVTSVSVYCNSVTTAAAYNAGTARWTATVYLNAGSNSFYARAYDAAGNSGITSTVTGTYNPPDGTPPVIESATPPSTNATSQLVSVMVTDNVAVTSVSVGNFTAAFYSGDEWRATVTGLSAGPNNFTINASDGANPASPYSYTLTYVPLDLTPPVIQSASPPSTNATSQLVSVMVTDNVAVTSVSVGGFAASLFSGDEWRATVTGLALGQNNFTINASDGSNAATPYAYSITYTDNTPPSAVILFPSGTNTTTATASQLVQVDASDANGIAAVTVNGQNAGYNTGTQLWETTLTLSPGYNAITAVAQDVPGNQTTSNTVGITYNPPDVTPPTVTITSHANNQWVNTTPITVSADASDGESGVFQMNMNGTYCAATSCSGSYPLSPGDNQIDAWASDVAGNSGLHRINVRYDNVLPWGSSGDDGAFVQAYTSYTIYVNAGDSESGLSSVSVAGSGTSSADVFIYYGENYFNVDLYDVAGNYYGFTIMITGN